MIRQLKISNFKSIKSETIPIEQFTVIIGENGAGKTNILEALVMASAASKGNLERELLIGRGVRVPSPDLMRSAFTSESKDKPITISISYDLETNPREELNFTITHDGEPYSNWKVANRGSELIQEKLINIFHKKFDPLPNENKIIEVRELKKETGELIKLLNKNINSKNINEDKKIETVKFKSPLFSIIFQSFLEKDNFERFTVYSPDYYTLRNFVAEGQTAPLGTRGEGLLKLLATMQEKEPERLKEVNEGLNMLGWYKEIDTDALSKKSSENKIYIKDRFIRRRGIALDQFSTNEGFLFCLFYLTLFTSSNTPSAFAIENIENGLNPKLCEALVKKLKTLGAKYNKQAIISTHSPSVLDAINLDDPNNLLISVERNLDGHTKINTIQKPRNTTGKVTRLSELFLKGFLGGIPKNFL